MSLFDDLRAISDKIAALPEPITYIVLDPNWSPSLPRVEGRDARGKRYVLCSPAVLDSNSGEVSLGRLCCIGIPVYLRANMAEGWPER